MDSQKPMPVVSTIKEKCRRCYTCVRKCPAKAIKVEEGQAKVVEERCIACGSCIRVCHQEAKAVRDSTAAVKDLFWKNENVMACLAPSFPAAFPQASPGQIVAGVKALGFSEVVEVAFGADRVAEAHARWAKENKDEIVHLLPVPRAGSLRTRRYYPSLVPFLAPVVSPMVAMGRVVKKVYRPGAKVVFIGPCIAKKGRGGRSGGGRGHRCGSHLRGIGGHVQGSRDLFGEAAGEKARRPDARGWGGSSRFRAVYCAAPP